MRCVTYNIQYGIGLDGKYDLARITDAVRGADVIALQEVTRNGPDNGGRDMVAEIADLLPDYFFVYDAPFRVDMGSAVEDGRAVNRHFQFGNMVLAKTPILSSRNLLLPRMRTFDRLNLQRGALEAMIDTPFGPLRFYSVHLDHTSPAERMAQVRFLVDKALAYPVEGGAVTGVSEHGYPEPPLPEGFVLMGDFNMQPGSPEYVEMTGPVDAEFGVTLRTRLPVDAARLAGAADERVTWIDIRKPDDPARRRCLDYCFVHAGLALHVKACWIDTAAVGSDHRPVWLELE
ncbi:endonuclease/exonuclease/phosphatase family protein [Mesorhizobium xinjiangense]|uniref:endonuclease/exonuclease/phosphatase family protein n=1 Tax=Mesorhizobium xinjiangense TaxID=2678685 RepID=UPI0012EDF5DA|nr:endonuclease/exonuclease/phosphatase family protein [Mesorhizobium xinjiangense]